jgi:hypothetical protein
MNVPRLKSERACRVALFHYCQQVVADLSNLIPPCRQNETEHCVCLFVCLTEAKRTFPRLSHWVWEIFAMENSSVRNDAHGHCPKDICSASRLHTGAISKGPLRIALDTFSHCVWSLRDLDSDAILCNELIARNAYFGSSSFARVVKRSTWTVGFKHILGPLIGQWSELRERCKHHIWFETSLFTVMEWMDSPLR